MNLVFNGRNRVTSAYGWRTLNGVKSWHAGLDIVGDDDKAVRSVCAGTVYSSTMVAKGSGDLTWQWGNYVCVKGDDGRYYYYCHLASRAVSKGQRVAAGGRLGVMGNTGYSFGAHTHFEVRKADRRTTVDPAAVLGIANRAGTYTEAADKPPALQAEDKQLHITAKNCEYFAGRDTAKPLGRLDIDTVYDVLQIDSAGATVSAGGKAYTGRWVEFRFANGETAWCLALSDRAELLDKPAEPVTSSGTVTVTAAVLNVRRAPGTRYGVAGTVKHGARLKTLEVSDGWGYVVTAGAAGWISLAYTEAV